MQHDLARTAHFRLESDRLLGPSITLSPQDYDAVLFGLDGVLTNTANVHAAVWKRLFDAFFDEEKQRLARLRPVADQVRAALGPALLSVVRKLWRASYPEWRAFMELLEEAPGILVTDEPEPHQSQQ